MPHASICPECAQSLGEHYIRSISLHDKKKQDFYLKEILNMVDSRHLNPRMHYFLCDDHFLAHKFTDFSDGQFRQKFRTTREGFATVLSLIQNHPTFHNKSNSKQAHPGWQLAVALHRFGIHGSGASVKEMANDFGISVGSVTTFTKRVIEAAVARSQEWIVWPDEDGRDEIAQVMREEGFPGCVGFIDGTRIPLSQKPALNGIEYLDRNQRYSVNAQIVCDVDQRIIALDVGYPGSCDDAHVHKEMQHRLHPEEYFSPGQYLLDDSAYVLSMNCITPFKSAEGNLPDHTKFNSYHALARVRSERCIGILKERWASLKEMREQLRCVGDMGIFVDWVHACCVLYNMLASVGDSWDEIFDDRQPEVVTASNSRLAKARTFRQTLKKTVLETNAAKGR